MSNDANQKNELKLEQVNMILSGKVTNEDVPSKLQPKKLHRLYHNLKLPHYKDPHKLKRFARWEEEVSKRIAEHFYDYKQTSFDIKSHKSKRNKGKGLIHYKARAIKAKVYSVKSRHM